MPLNPDPNADTEFNDALRAHGILPPKPPTPPSPSTFLPSQAQLLHSALDSSSAQRLGEMAEDAADSDDERMFEAYRQKKVQEMKKMELAERGVAEGRGLRQIGRDEFVREVSEASAKDVEALGEDGEGRGTGVVCFLYKDSIPASNHLRQILNLLSPLHPLTRFLSVQGDQCIPNYPDKNIPTLLLYRNGDCLGQVVGLKGGLRTTAMGKHAPINLLKNPRVTRSLITYPNSAGHADIERLLLGYKMIEKPNPQTPRVWKRHIKQTRSGMIGGDVSSDSDGDGSLGDSDEDAQFGTIARGRKGEGRGLKQGGSGAGLGLSGTGKRRDGDEDDFDFDL
ncbi:hypothetical protein QFC21_005279 [Naganishia friedmannii]|uniref:Uncharacterized protein n=1 Tax=Naganishia friedmannii TaxID=89922 RepID=A0ACC2VAY8_9TREE|nr:hypothetical protein QFC21_005279 [Naganishia friedmannii]